MEATSIPTRNELIKLLGLQIKWMGNHGYLHSSDQQTPYLLEKVDK